MSSNKPDSRFTYTETVTKEVTGPIRDLIAFAHFLKENHWNVSPRTLTNGGSRVVTNQDIIAAALEFWDQQHGED